MKKKRLIVFFCVFALCLTVGAGYGQEASAVVNPLSVSKRHMVLYNLWVYGLGRQTGYSMVNTAAVPLNTDRLYNTNIDVGLCTDVSVAPCRVWGKDKNPHSAVILLNRMETAHFNVGMGYRAELFSFRTGNEKWQGLIHHCMSWELAARYFMLTAGMSANALIKSGMRNVNDARYAGLQDVCFNRFTLRWFVGIYLPISFVDIELRWGTYIIPQLNPDKFAYYNMSKVRWDSVCWELRLAFRLFTTGNKFN